MVARQEEQYLRHRFIVAVPVYSQEEQDCNNNKEVIYLSGQKSSCGWLRFRRYTRVRDGECRANTLGTQEYTDCLSPC